MRPKTGSESRRKAGRNCGGSWNERPSSPPVTVDICEARTAAADATASVIIEKKIARTRSDSRPMATARTAESINAAATPIATEVQVGPEPLQRDGDPVAADAEEHRVGEGDDPRIAEEQVVACDQRDEHADLRGGARAAGCRRTGMASRRERRRCRSGWSRARANAADRMTGGARSRIAVAPLQKELGRGGDHRRATGNSPCGRQTSTSAITRILEINASLGARKPT